MFEAEQVLKRVDKMGDLFDPALELKQKLPKPAGLAPGKPAAAGAGLEMAAQAEVKAGRRKTEAAIRTQAAGGVPEGPQDIICRLTG